MPFLLEDIDFNKRFLVVGKKGCIWKNPLGRYRGEFKRYEVFIFNELGMPMRFDLNTPYYQEYGWDDLTEAKAFYLLNEI